MTSNRDQRCYAGGGHTIGHTCTSLLPFAKRFPKVARFTGDFVMVLSLISLPEPARRNLPHAERLGPNQLYPLRTADECGPEHNGQ